MKLNASVWYACAGSYDIASGFVHKQQNWRDKRRQTASQLGSSLQSDGAWAWGVQHKAYGVGTGLNGGIHVLLARQATDFDAGAGGNQRHGGVACNSGLAAARRFRVARQRGAYRRADPSVHRRWGRGSTAHQARKWAQPPRASAHPAPAASTPRAWSPGPRKSGNP